MYMHLHNVCTDIYGMATPNEVPGRSQMQRTIRVASKIILLHSEAAAHLMFVAIAASGTECCCKYLSL